MPFIFIAAAPWRAKCQAHDILLILMLFCRTVTIIAAMSPDAVSYHPLARHGATLYVMPFAVCEMRCVRPPPRSTTADAEAQRGRGRGQADEPRFSAPIRHAAEERAGEDGALLPRRIVDGAPCLCAMPLFFHALPLMMAPFCLRSLCAERRRARERYSAPQSRAISAVLPARAYAGAQYAAAAISSTTASSPSSYHGHAVEPPSPAITRHDFIV